MQALIHWKTKLRTAGGKQVENNNSFWRLTIFQANNKYF